MNKQRITIQADIKRAVDEVWKLYTEPEHIVKWNHASKEWHTPTAKNDLKVGGKFLFRMQAKDGSRGFDFKGMYEEVRTNALIAYAMADGRKVRITFTKHDETTNVSMTFDAESENPVKMQRDGWQAILNNFKNYAQRQLLPGTTEN